jgi:hypothetical protein
MNSFVACQRSVRGSLRGDSSKGSEGSFLPKVEVSPKKKSWGIPSAGPAYSHKGVARRRGMEAMLENAEKMLGGDSEGRPRQKDSS